MARRYDQAEIARILARASRDEVTRPLSPAEHGLTMGEVQEIGLEVGIPVERIVAAAAELEGVGGVRSPLRSTRADATMTRVVNLGSAPSQHEWDRMVVGLRDVFRGPGSVQQDGSLRSWTAPGVEVHGGPTDAGYRIRVDAVNGTAVQAVGVGVSSMVVSVIMAGGLALSGAGDPFTFAASGLVGLVGGVSTLYGRYVLSGWRARTERRLSQAVGLLTRARE